MGSATAWGPGKVRSRGCDHQEFPAMSLSKFITAVSSRATLRGPSHKLGTRKGSAGVCRTGPRDSVGPGPGQRLKTRRWAPGETGHTQSGPAPVQAREPIFPGWPQAAEDSDNHTSLGATERGGASHRVVPDTQSATGSHPQPGDWESPGRS